MISSLQINIKSPMTRLPLLNCSWGRACRFYLVIEVEEGVRRMEQLRSREGGSTETLSRANSDQSYAFTYEQI